MAAYKGEDENPMNKKTLAKKVGKALAAHRKQSGLTQAQVASELKIETETVSRLETGAISATLERLEQFSELFGCSVEVFFQENDDDAEGFAKKMAGMIKPLKSDEQKLLLNFVTEAIKLFKARK